MSAARLEPLEAPEFRPNVPEPLLGMCDDSAEGHIRRYLLESNSKQEQQTAWLCRNAVEENKELRRIEERVNEAETEIKSVMVWKDTLTGKAAILGATLFIVASAIVGTALKVLLDAVLHKP